MKQLSNIDVKTINIRAIITQATIHTNSTEFNSRNKKGDIGIGTPQANTSRS